VRFPHHAKIFRGQLDAAPFAGVFFLLLIFLFAQSTMVFIPGIPIHLPPSANLPGVGTPTVSVALSDDGFIYFQNQITGEDQLRDQLRSAVARTPEPLTLVIQADRKVPHETLVRMAVLAREAGIKEALLATRPTVIPEPFPARP